MQTILFIDGDIRAPYSLLPALRERFPDYAIQASSGSASAWELARQHLPDLIILDLEVALMDGFDLFGKIHELLPKTPLILTCTNRFVLQNFQKRFENQHRLQSLPKPFTSAQLIETAVEAMCGRPVSVLRDLTLASVLQLLSLEGKSCWLDVITPTGRGSCRFLRGEIVYAVCGIHSGVDAVQEMMRFSAPVFQVFAGTDVLPLKRNVFARFDAVLLHCCSSFDERIHVA